MLELKSKIIEMKNSLEGCYNRYVPVKEKQSANYQVSD
jgi:hypothetical protein